MKRVPILLYHSVSEAPPAWIAPFAVPPSAFRRHLDLILEARATPLTVGEYVRALAGGVPLPDRPVLVTFDDGLADLREHALPAIVESGVTATLYATSGFVDGETLPDSVTRPAGPWLDPAGLRELRDNGIEIGAHSHTHPHLDTLSTPAARSELVRSKAVLEDMLGAPVESFAYPHGYFGPRIRRLVVESGFASACAVKNAFSSQTDDVYGLARLTVRNDTAPGEIEAWLDGRGAPVATRSERPRTRAWRAYRRGRAVVTRRPGSDWS